MTASLAGLEAWVREFARLVIADADHLTALDSAIGDADHGANLSRGLSTVVKTLDSERFDAADGLFKRVGMVLVSTVGGASGPLYGTFFLRLGAALPGASSVDGVDLAAGFRAGVEGLAGRGRAVAGDKTMLDALLPAAEALAKHSDEGAPAAWAAALAAAEAGRDATEPLVARKGRASYLGERSAGHVDPGAVSATLLVAAGAATLGAGDA
jgi:dihydroxyacetone kinase-like protein